MDVFFYNCCSIVEGHACLLSSQLVDGHGLFTINANCQRLWFVYNRHIVVDGCGLTVPDIPWTDVFV